MQSIIGIFQSRIAAERAWNGQLAIGVPPERLGFITPETDEAELARIPTTSAEEPGIGKAITGYVGGLIGASGGLALGSAIAGALVPGVGPVIIGGLGAAALFGAGGAAAGVAVGDEMERKYDTGIPVDDLPIYKELVRDGRSLVFAFVDTKQLAEASEDVMREEGTEDVSEARSRAEARIDADNDNRKREAA